jgi:hypothetical protein
MKFSEFVGMGLMAVALNLVVGGAFLGDSIIMLCAMAPLGVAALLPD